ncbi:Putative ribonuclease H protein At1g65750 [Linum perenne]
MYADDTVIFGKACRDEANRLKGVLAQYSILSGQKVNDEKSVVLFSKNTPEEVCQTIVDILGVPRRASFGKYLGLPAEWGNSKTETFHFLLDRMTNKAGNWKSLLLSQGGKETLAKAVLQATPSYVFSCFMLPDTLLKKLDAVVAKFWWSGYVNRKSIHWCSKDRLTTPKQDGGLGFRSFKEFNLAHLAKLCWRIVQQPEALWVRVLKALYFPRNEFFEASGHHRPSWIWGSILKGRTALLKGLRKHIGNGCDTRFEEAWFPGSDDFCYSPNDTEMRGLRIADCILQDTRQWDVRKLRGMFNEDIVQEIRKIPIGPAYLKDRWIWHHDTKGVFSIKSCYKMLKSGREGWRGHTGNQNGEWKWIWRLSMPPKVKHFVWKVCSNLVATRENLMRRRCAQDPLCPCCRREDETVIHLLFGCNLTKELWTELLPGITSPCPQHSIADWFKSLLENENQERCI